MNNAKKYAFLFIGAGLISLLLGLLCGLLSGLQYVVPDFIKETLPFNSLRPLHTFFVVSWILLAATGGIYYYLTQNQEIKFYAPKLIQWHFWIFIPTGIGIAISYVTHNFGGKEYLEFPAYFYFPIMAGWILLGINYFKTMLPNFKTWPVYYWMWGTGTIFMIFHFTEAHLWLLSSFRSEFLRNLAIQWKAGGSYVGAWNQLVYGTALFVMSKISDDESYAKSKKAFFFYFLGLTNLMFGWAHHIYIVPTAPWIRYVAYAISMTEWIILFSIIHDWKKNLGKEKKRANFVAYKFMILADLWVFLNIILALLISIPSINLFTHGTHITVAHSMGTTIGINTLILFSSITYMLEKEFSFSATVLIKIKQGIKIFHISFICFWITLLVLGIKKGHWAYFSQHIPFGKFQNSMHWIYVVFVLFGFGLLTGLYLISFKLLQLIRNKFRT